MQASIYDPYSQKFLSEDKLGFNSDDSNFYRYVLNKPLTNSDPYGLSANPADSGASTPDSRCHNVILQNVQNKCSSELGAVAITASCTFGGCVAAAAITKTGPAGYFACSKVVGPILNTIPAAMTYDCSTKEAIKTMESSFDCKLAYPQ